MMKSFFGAYFVFIWAKSSKKVHFVSFCEGEGSLPATCVRPLLSDVLRDEVLSTTISTPALLTIRPDPPQTNWVFPPPSSSYWSGLRNLQTFKVWDSQKSICQKKEINLIFHFAKSIPKL